MASDISSPGQIVRNSSSNGSALTIHNSYGPVGGYQKSYGYTLRCIRD